MNKYIVPFLKKDTCKYCNSKLNTEYCTYCNINLFITRTYLVRFYRELLLQ